ncbi:hypothetical protein [Actinomadura vinacea]|uniref:hypothetical protein n=1 Tax=Actinomadura vinacea TaxID=115336 RepID=UPI0031D8CFF7
MTGALTATVITALPATAAPCTLPGGNLDCSKSSPGGSSGGGIGTGGGGGGGSTGEIPTLDGLDSGGIGAQNAPPQAAAAVPTAVLAQQARDSAQFPVPQVHTSPEGRTYVRVRTGLWVEGFTTVSTEPITVDGQTIQATATPKRVEWNLGETTLTCNGAGSQNDTTCSHTYQRSSTQQPGGAYQITATIYWGVAWTCTGANCDAAGGTLEDASSPSAPTPLIVGEIQTNTQQ